MYLNHTPMTTFTHGLDPSLHYTIVLVIFIYIMIRSLLQLIDCAIKLVNQKDTSIPRFLDCCLARAKLYITRYNDLIEHRTGLRCL